MSELPAQQTPFANGDSGHRLSANLTADPLDGDKLSELRYKAWGETRHSLTNAPTDRRYTGQAEDSGYRVILLWGEILRP